MEDSSANLNQSPCSATWVQGPESGIVCWSLQCHSNSAWMSPASVPSPTTLKATRHPTFDSFFFNVLFTSYITLFPKRGECWTKTRHPSSLSLAIVTTSSSVSWGENAVWWEWLGLVFLVLFFSPVDRNTHTLSFLSFSLSLLSTPASRRTQVRFLQAHVKAECSSVTHVWILVFLHGDGRWR